MNPMMDAMLEDARIDPTRHRLLDEHDWPWLQAIKRMVESDDLFVYHHREHGSFVLCQWIDERERTFNELEVFHGDVTALWPEDLPPLEILRFTLRRAEDVYHERVRARTSMMAHREHLELEEEVEKGDTVKYLKKQGLEKAAQDLEVGVTPYVAPSQSQIPDRDEVVKEMVNMVRKA